MPSTRAALRQAPSECPVCGEELSPRAQACPACGADEKTGWNDEVTRYDGLDLPESAFDDATAPRRQARARHPGRPHPFWVLIAIGLTVLFLGFALFGH